MTLTAKDVEEITRLIEESSFDELQLEIDGMKLSLRRRGAAACEAGIAPAPAPPPEPERARPPDAPPTVTPGATDADIRAVPAPLLGTFYRAPKPGAAPFIEIGSQVTADTVIGIIEVMKLMNSVRAGESGTVVEIPAQDGALVEYGETLLRVRKPVDT